MNRQQFARQLGRSDHQHGNPTRRHVVLQKLVREAGAAWIISKGKITGYRMPDGSVVCRKRRFRDERSAVYELAQIAATSRHSHIPVRAYACGRCHGFHLTSSA